MRENSTLYTSRFIRYAAFAVVLAIAACSLEKQSAVNRGLQNLTAKYNILFNANEILRAKQEAYAQAYIDDYSELLSVYQDTTAGMDQPDPDLDAVKKRANTIISVKEQSHYLGDAYMLLCKANFLDGNYFDAIEYANYVIRSYGTQQPDLRQEALVYKARALLYIRQPNDAKTALDTALRNVNPKKNITADVYASKLQYDINVQEYTDAEAMAKLAIEYANNSRQRLRWTYILGQLQELNHKPAEAIESYNRVAKSNALFDMAFNANLNRIRIEEGQTGVKLTRTARLRSLLKNQNNKDFADQIYYQIGELQYADGNVDEALKSYAQSVKVNTKNQTQRGLSYLRSADIYFKNKADYVRAKIYYDSTLANLPPNYPRYITIAKKADNLQVLADALQAIAHQDTLQMLAKLDETARTQRIDKMAEAQALKQARQANIAISAQARNTVNVNEPPAESTPTGTAFYFNNANAVSQGFSNFKRVWGNRKLEDNWRRANRASSNITQNNTVTPVNTDPDIVANDPASPGNAGNIAATNYKQQILQELPLNAQLMARSNRIILDAYMDIANFYRDILDDKKEAIIAFEKVLSRFPANDNTPAIYYNLYRLYTDTRDELSANRYKDLLVKNYPQTPFAKTILDPEYARHVADEDNGFAMLYNKVYDLYAARKYADMITSADALLAQYPNNRYAAQVYYLRAFAAAHQEPLTPFANDLQQIATRYPNDKLITPLVNQHLAYIAANQTELAQRKVVLSDRDVTDPLFTLPIVYQQKTEYRVPAEKIEVVPDVRKPEELAVSTPEPVIKEKASEITKKELKPIAKPAEQPMAEKHAEQGVVGKPEPATPTVTKPKYNTSIFSKRDSTNYYFVVNVSSGTTNLASSRFGIGQFNRVNFEGNTIKHQLKAVGADNQLIYVGRFSSLNNVKDYARNIIPLMPDIMKVPKDKYSFFIITQENLDKLADKIALDSYYQYYQENY
ncbi:tetratricopeptide repeat protein [Mucilaginibacter sp. 21P]|uniref:type IX secretion system periplasmic lipoprotein PorW/SprE n=1 Tax=Mucilaginibacter sp. 21P TaxID=2778902 RepID=UPI001C594AB3|nr:tetratricopeptide repeat protein [Mucilaginibacter sp. 21P]QXV65450.1 tetratricopeptide repeat protein [Mucilaginibacter sp. 21P]